MPRHLPLAALLTAGAGATHLAAAVPHFSSSPLYGALFVGAGWVQILLAALLLASARTGVAWIAIAVNAGSLLAWAISRTVGLPLAHQEPVLLADALTVGLEVGAIVVLVARVRGAAFALRAGQVSVLPLVAVLALSFGASTVAIAGLSSEDHGHGTDSGGGDDHHAASGGSTEEVTSPSDSEESGAEAHEHPDGTVHVHEAGKPHIHPDRTVHIHTADADQRAGEKRTDGGGHDDGGDHEHEDDEH